MPSRLDGKVALVTGAATGIGKAAAGLFHAEGADVVCVDVDGDALEATVRQLAGDEPGSVRAATADVTDDEALERVVADLVAEFGKVDVLYANAGVSGVGSVAETDVATWNRVIAVNLTGVWLSVRAVLPTMVRQGRGSIITQASVAGMVAMTGVAPYAAAKGGVISLTRQAAAEGGPHGVRVNAIAPGTVRTSMVQTTYQDRHHAGMGPPVDVALEASARNYPLGRLGTVEEVANVALFLASDDSSWVTGAVYVVDGGLTAL